MAALAQDGFNFEEYGLEKAVGAIKFRLQQLGVAFRTESLAERASRSAKIGAYNQETQWLLDCQEGVQQATKTAQEYLAKVEQLAGELRDFFPGIRIGKDIYQVAFTTARASLHTAWICRSINSLREASIEIRIYSQSIVLPGDPVLLYRDSPASSREVRYKPDRFDGIGWCWKSPKDSQVRTSEELAKYAIGLFLDQIEGKGEREKFQVFFI